MRCFNHAEVRAVGLCKNCGKGICHECLVDLGNGLACKPQCEERVSILIEYSQLAVKQGLHSLKRGDAQAKNSAFFLQAIGALFFGVGIFQFVSYGNSPIDIVPITLGVFFLWWGACSFRQKEK